MIFLNEQSQTIKIPRHERTSGGYYALNVTRNLTGEVREFDALDNTSETALFYEFAVDNWLSAYGEYTYELSEDTGKVLEIGIIRYGDFTGEISEYNGNEETNKVYEQ